MGHEKSVPLTSFILNGLKPLEVFIKLTKKYQFDKLTKSTNNNYL